MELKAKDLEVASFVELRFVHINPYTKVSKNETVTFEKVENGESFVIRSGATQIKRGPKKARVEEYPLEDWNYQLARYIKKGFDPVSTKKADIIEINVGNGFVPLKDAELQAFVEAMMAANNEMIESSYSVKKLTDIPQEHIDHAQEALIKLSTNKDALSINEFNEILMKDILTYIPRPTSNLKKSLASKTEQFTDIIDKEQEFLDNLCQLLKNKVQNNNNLDILSAHGLEGRKVTDEEEKWIKELMTDRSNQYSRAWKVKNPETEAAFNKFCKDNNLSEGNGIDHLFHGTGFENVWSIYKNGLYLNPAVLKSNVRISGKAFGYGLYFAPYCYKSMGYASVRGARYGSGTGNTGYLLIFKVATGNRYYIYRDRAANRPNHWEDFHKDHPENHCCWAERGQQPLDCGLNRLAMDEVIVYRQDQATIEYIVEFNSNF